MDKELIDAIESLKESVDKLTAIQTDIFNTDSSTDDTTSLKNRMSELIQSNKELKQQILWLTGAINELSQKIKNV